METQSQNTELSYDEALRESDKFIESLYLEKIESVRKTIWTTPINQDYMMPVDKETEDDLFSLMEEMKLTIDVLQQFMRERHVLSYSYFEVYRQILNILEYQIKYK